ncbi:TIGR01841 family phasin [Stappia sp. GBMRC 2046]|uniref:TIGR01841 family phasin n=1 Tax=Stappia sediminis TaxID=2692190 RepID=A0A7X3S6S8_9HYPH|nr:phasin family protein [Stappia sediminis]MXN64140.1 TIGR01841 family phasin [Stappia sediminis]
MLNNFDDIQKLNKDNMDLVMQSFGSMTKGVQAIVSEVADYQKKSFEEGSSAVEKFTSAKSLDKAFEVQSEFVKTAYESYVGELTKLGEMVGDLAREAYKPYESAFSKVAK